MGEEGGGKRRGAANGKFLKQTREMLMSSSSSVDWRTNTFPPPPLSDNGKQGNDSNLCFSLTNPIFFWISSISFDGITRTNVLQAQYVLMASLASC